MGQHTGLKDGRVRSSYSTADGLPSGEIADLRFDRDGALWVATQHGGLSRLKDGRFTTLTTSNGLPCNVVHWSIEDDDGALWLYMGCGLVRIRQTELDAWIADPQHKVEATVWEAADGVRLRSIAASGYGPRIAKAGDGKLWYVTGEGIQVIDPHHLAVNTLPPPVHIEKILADQKVHWQNLPGPAVSNLRLPARTRDIEIDYTALSLVAPEKVHSRYKLEGQDSDWREVVNDRQIHYSNLAPRGYRFRVIACNNSGVWNEQGDALEFSVDPAFYQTNWFRALCAVLILALAWAIYQLRVRHLSREFARTLDARVTERTRIARDIHDTLLQSAHGLVVQLEVVSQMLPDLPVEAKQRLDRTIDLAAKTVTEGRDAVQGLRDSTVQTNDLARDVNTLGEELAADPTHYPPPEFSVIVEGTGRNLHPIVRDEIYRIAAEALQNAFRHAQASKVEIETRYDDDKFSLRVRDDGKGIEPAVLSHEGKELHYGLPGMRERAKLIGGHLEIWSEIDAGTEVELRIAAATAYATTAKRSWISELLAKK